jgi:type II secretory pathway pseudopilin PulG
MKRSSGNRPRNRRAAAMAMALVVLLVVGMVSGLTLQAILRSHRQVREEADRVQAELLAESALSRAAAMLAGNPSWGGETWKVSLTDPADLATSGVATIRVEKGPDASRLRIFINAIYPDDLVHRAQAEREVAYSLVKQGDNK